MNRLETMSPLEQMVALAWRQEAASILGFEADDGVLNQILGFEKGFNQAADIIYETTDGASLQDMWREFNASIQLLNKGRDPLINMLTYTVTKNTEKVLQPSSEDFEEASEYGEPKGVRLGVPFVLGFPFKWYDLAIRYTWMFLIDADAEQVRALNATALEASRRLVFGQVMKAVFNNVNSTANLTNGTSVNVYKFYNNDGTVPPPYKGTTFAGTHQHYITSGAATIDPGDMAALEDHLYHHGYRLSDGYKLVLLCNRQESQVIRTFVAGVNSSLYTFIPGQAIGGGVYLPANSGIVGRPGESGPAGLLAVGTYGPFVIVEEDYIPAGYVVALASSGDQNLRNPIGIREHPSHKGLQLVKGAQPDYPLQDSFYRQGMGTGIRQRGAGVVMQITAAGTYTIPAAYV
jgi:hypothetical protein